MQSLRACFLAALFVLGTSSCGKVAGGSALPPHVTNICPDNPNQCGGHCCGSACIDTTSDPNNCGDCDVVCPNGSSCVNSMCGGCGPSGNSCGTGQMCCGANGCKSLDSDVNNCGGCGNACATGEECQSSQCVCLTGSCGTPVDMGGGGGPDGGGSCNDCNPACDTADGDMCLGNNCCFFDYLINGTCTPDPNCGF